MLSANDKRRSEQCGESGEPNTRVEMETPGMP